MVPMRGLPIDKGHFVVYNGFMDNNDLLQLQQEPISVERIVDSVHDGGEGVVLQIVQPDKYAVAVQENKQDVIEAVDIERERRRSELQFWASKQRLISNAPPTVKQLKRIHNRLKKGYTIVRAIHKVCSYTTWQKWKEDYPECAVLEEQARQEYVEDLLDKKMELAAKPGTKMGEIARDKIQMDELQNRIDRIDRLTENRNKKSSAFGGSVIPIQINVGYGRKETNKHTAG